MVLLGRWLDLMILEVFSNLWWFYDSISHKDLIVFSCEMQNSNHGKN